MDQEQNRDDLIKRVITQREKDGKRVVDSKERQQIAEHVKKKIMPNVYEK